jgi:hypothetical protein
MPNTNRSEQSETIYTLRGGTFDDDAPGFRRRVKGTTVCDIVGNLLIQADAIYGQPCSLHFQVTSSINPAQPIRPTLAEPDLGYFEQRRLPAAALTCHSCQQA